MARSRIVLSLCACAFIAGAGCHARAAAAALPGTPEPLPIARFRTDNRAFTAYSGVDDSLTAVIRDSASWRHHWAVVHRRVMPQPPLPEVDFDREIVVLAALGSRPSGGHDIFIEEAREEADAVVVTVRRTAPAPSCLVTAAFTQPADLVRIPARSKPVRFVHRHQTTEC